MIRADRIAAFLGALTIRATAMTNGVHVLFGQTQTGVNVLKIVHPDRNSVTQPGNQTRGCQCEMRLEAINTKI